MSRCGADALLRVRLSCYVYAFGVRRRLKMERLGEFRRIEDVVEFVLVEHLVQFTYCLVEPSSHPEHRPGEDTVLRFSPELVGGEFNELLSRRRIGGSRNVPGLIPGALVVR